METEPSFLDSLRSNILAIIESSGNVGEITFAINDVDYTMYRTTGDVLASNGESDQWDSVLPEMVLRRSIHRPFGQNDEITSNALRQSLRSASGDRKHESSHNQMAYSTTTPRFSIAGRQSSKKLYDMEVDDLLEDVEEIEQVEQELHEPSLIREMFAKNPTATFGDVLRSLIEQDFAGNAAKEEKM